MISDMNSPNIVFYPGSDKVLAIGRLPGSEGDEDELACRFRKADAVDYWKSEPGASSG